MKFKFFSKYYFVAAFSFIIYGCKKEPSTSSSSVFKSQVTLGLYEFLTGIDKRLLIPINKIGNQTIFYYSIFDTGSAGMAIDATGILPASMITDSGIQVTGDSIKINGITVTSKQSVINFGNLTGLTKEYGNLAYAPVTIGIVTEVSKLNVFLFFYIIKL